MVRTVPGSLLIKAAADELLRSFSPQSQSQLPSWDRGPAVSPADMRTDAFTARPLRSQSFRDPPLKGGWPVALSGAGSRDRPVLCLPPPGADPSLCGIERQRPGSLSSALGGQGHAFPALPRPSGMTTPLSL